MIKKAALALFSLVLGVGMMAPQKANAQVGIGVYVGPRPVYVAPHPVYVAPRPVVIVPPYAFNVFAPGRVFVRGYWYPRWYAVRYFGYRGYYGRPYYRARWRRY
jgi:hypothetical protein